MRFLKPMQKCAIKLTNHQLMLASNTDYPLTKNQVIQNICLLFDALAKELQSAAYPATFSMLNHATYKITKGENYKGLPYVVLDYPKISGPQFPILFRTVFWWGNYFSFNVLVQDKELQKHINLHDATDVYLLTGTNVWENDLRSNAYIKINSNQATAALPDADCLRIACMIPIDAYETLIEKSQFYSRLINSHENQ